MLPARAGTLAAVRALAKSFDIIVSFIIGFASDKTRTPLGRRLPYIVVGSLFAPVAMWYLAAPPEEWNLNTLANTAMSTTAGLRKRGSFLPFNEVSIERRMPASPFVVAHANDLLLACRRFASQKRLRRPWPLQRHRHRPRRWHPLRPTALPFSSALKAPSHLPRCQIGSTRGMLTMARVHKLRRTRCPCQCGSSSFSSCVTRSATRW
jgi:hypothetical protein